MTEQALDLRRAARIAWRRKIIIGIMAGIGLLAGAVYTALSPPAMSSMALVALPSANANMSTQSLIATSEPVLSTALRSAGLSMSVQQLHGEVKAHSAAANVLAITAQGNSSAQAENIATAVANSYIAFATSATNPIGKVQARLLQSATTATGSSLVVYLIRTAVIGALVGALVGFIIALALSRKDRRLHRRDEIADSIGLPVLASAPVGHPSDPPGWLNLIENYEPGVVYSWRLRKALYDLGVSDIDFDGPTDAGVTLLFLSLSSDPGALALGPQLAAFAASLGIRTSLVMGQVDDSEPAAALRAACATSPSLVPGRPGRLSLSPGESGLDRPSDAALTIVVAVVDSAAPQVTDLAQADVTVLGVSAGIVTAEEMARVAVGSADDGRRITGVFVADPEAGDNTTGRLPQLTRPRVRRVPTRLTRTTSEIRR